MTLKEQIAADLNTIFFNTGEFAETVTYTPVVGAAKVIKAVVTYGDGDGLNGADAFNVVASMEIMADAANGIAQPAAGDRVSIGATDWVVGFAALIDDGLVWQCSISRLNR